MAVFKSLTFDGINSLDYGIYVTGEAVYNAPERAVEMVTIPGRNGALAIDQGYFENIEVSYPCGCFAETQAEFASKVSAFRNAIGSRYSYKRLTDEYNADEYRLGLYKSGLEVSAVRYGTAGQFTITFDCKPQRFLLDGDAELSPTDYSDVHTVSGDIVQIENDGSLGVKSLTASLEPIQDLHGYDKPWSGGAGKNLLDIGSRVNQTTASIVYTSDDNYITMNGTKSGGGYANLSNLTISLEAGTYYARAFAISGTTTYNPYIYLFDGTANLNTSSMLGAEREITIDTAKTCTIRVGIFTDGVVFTNFKIGIVISKTSGITSWTPYSNICPISGHTECVTSVCGKNWLNVAPRSFSLVGVSFTINADGSVTATGTATSNSVIPLINTTYLDVEEYGLKNEVPYTLSCEGSSANFRFGLVPQTASNFWILGEERNYTFDKTEKYRIALYVTSGTVLNTTIYPMIRLASETDTTYEPYNGNTYTTDLGRTVYGGTLDVVSGVLTVDKAMVDLGSLTWNFSPSTQTMYSNVSSWSQPIKNNTDADVVANILCENYAPDTGARVYSRAEDGIISYLNHPGYGGNLLRIYDSNYTDSTAFKQALSGVMLCYELATPQTYQLTPTEVQTLLGTNNLWADCGDSTVEYGIPPYYNPTEFDAKPLIKVTGTGTLGIGEYILTITGTSSQTLYIDCETMEIYKLEGTVPTGASSLVSINRADFPVLKPGQNGVSVGSGLSALTIIPKWWRI